MLAACELCLGAASPKLFVLFVIVEVGVATADVRHRFVIVRLSVSSLYQDVLTVLPIAGPASLVITLQLLHIIDLKLGMLLESCFHVIKTEIAIGLVAGWWAFDITILRYAG